LKITTKTGWVAFLITITTLNISIAEAKSSNNAFNDPSLESRLSRIAATLKQRQNQLSESDSNQPESEIALGWADGGGGRGFANTRRGGWGDGYRGGFANVNPWRNGWGDGGGFYNIHR
jgi:rSAM-associated Gly-rich repeat protein